MCMFLVYMKDGYENFTTYKVHKICKWSLYFLTLNISMV